MPAARSVPSAVVDLFHKAAAVAGSTHTGRALKVAKVLNLVGTVRGAVTTVLLASSAIGGAVTVNNVRQDIVKDNASAAAAASRPARTAAPPPLAPLTAAGVRADAEKRLRAGLDQDAAAADDLRKVTVLSADATGALILQTREKLQARFEQALVQIDALLAVPSPVAAASGSPRPSASLSVVAVSAIVQVALGDLSGILFVATRAATTVARQTFTSTPVPTVLRSPSPTPVHTPSPTVKASPTR